MSALPVSHSCDGPGLVAVPWDTGPDQDRVTVARGSIAEIPAVAPPCPRDGVIPGEG